MPDLTQAQLDAEAVRLMAEARRRDRPGKPLAERVEDAAGAPCPHCLARPLVYGEGDWHCANCDEGGLAFLVAPGMSDQQAPLPVTEGDE